MRIGFLIAVFVLACCAPILYVPNSGARNWYAVDGILGLNKNPLKTAIGPTLATANSKLYAFWTEDGASALQIRARVYRGNDDSPAWTFVDGNGVDGINKDPTKGAILPVPAVLNSKLYLIWSEAGTAASQVRVAVYNGNDSSPGWAFVDGNGANGINRTITDSAFWPTAKVFNSKIYATWSELAAGDFQVRVAVYNGNDGAPAWSFVDGNLATGLNWDPTEGGILPSLETYNGKLYLTWAESRVGVDKVRVAVYNGNDGAPAWTFVDGNGTDGINLTTTNSASIPTLSSYNGKLYAGWYESVSGIIQVTAKVYNGNDGAPSWSSVVGDGINRNMSQISTEISFLPLSSILYAVWGETLSGKTQIRVASYNGFDSAPAWNFEPSESPSLNRSPLYDAGSPRLGSINNNLYCIWQENSSAGVFRIRASVYR